MLSVCFDNDDLFHFYAQVNIKINDIEQDKRS
ncbi:hypothetical protein EPIR_2408 [Erwinia piriflorinigrans CFBP 5888]|uniref:Uncharacterized protein n=1 Tax=Erwinia piriflorinigrans CFBP 5888 TaxID=1161919 RepID=V5Z9Z1_9GAMM|nr:hypothetical protein EPIR_2408 [Erwinia piriflorinigrans CFBP 5888]